MVRKRQRASTDVSAEDVQLFRESIGPLRELPPVAPRAVRPRPAPRARQRERDEAAALADSRYRPFDSSLVDPAEPLAFRRPEVPGDVLARLRRGGYAAEDELDLHGLRVDTARTVLRAFLAEARREGRHCVRIIHGKGRNSETGTPVLKLLVDDMLRRHHEVLAYASAPAAQGGTGAVLALLGRRRG